MAIATLDPQARAGLLNALARLDRPISRLARPEAYRHTAAVLATTITKPIQRPFQAQSRAA